MTLGQINNLNRPLPAEDLRNVTALIESSMATWRGARILLTGATGFFGRWLVETFHHANQILDLGAELTGVGAPTDDFATQCPHLLEFCDVRMIRADIRRLGDELTSQLPGWGDRIDAVIHAAIQVDSTSYDRQPLPTLETAVMGTWQALDVARNANVRRFLFVSSGAIYGTQPRHVDNVDENQTVNLDCAIPQSAYAEGKRIGETLCAAYHRQYGLPVSIVRPFAFVGPCLPLDRQFAIGNFLRDALRGGPLVIQSDGRPLRSYLYASDLAVWLWTILARGTIGRPYNVGSECAVSLRQAAELIARIVSGPITIEVRGVAESGPPPRYVPSTLRARNELGLSESVNLEEAVTRTLAWYEGLT
jgi:dTDP-glucose 4,6-dehydratase